MPSALAVFMLMTTSNLVDCMIGRSAGFLPSRIQPDLAGDKVSLIVAAGSPAAAVAAKSVITSIPIVFNNSADPVKIGRDR